MDIESKSELVHNDQNTDCSDERSQLLEGLRKGLAESKAGLGRPAEDVFADMKAKYGF